MKSILPGVFSLQNGDCFTISDVFASDTAVPTKRFLLSGIGWLCIPWQCANEQFSSRHFYVSWWEFVHLHIKKEYKHFPHSETRKPGHTFFTKSPQTHHIFTTFQTQIADILLDIKNKNNKHQASEKENWMSKYRR